MTAPGKPPHLTLVTNTEELRQRIADKIPKKRRGGLLRGRPRKPAPASAPASDRPITESEIAQLHCKAFRDLEGGVCDLERMGQIAQDLIVQCVAGEDGYRELELSTFAVAQLAKMLRDFKDQYYQRWYGEMAGVS